MIEKRATPSGENKTFGRMLWTDRGHASISLL